MRILQLHVRYSQGLTSGENSTVELIAGYLSSKYIVDRIIFVANPKTKKLSETVSHYVNQILLFFSLFNRRKHYDIILVHNQLPFVPALLLLYFSRKCLVVKVWHNVRPFCVRGSAFINGEVCWKCTRSNWRQINSFIKKCYRDSLLQTIVANISQAWILQILKSPKIVNLCISDYLQSVLLSHGFSESQVFVIQNSVPLKPRPKNLGDDFLYIGRMVEEKGVVNLLIAWQLYCEMFDDQAKLHLVGDGPLLVSMKERFENSRTVFSGHLDSSEILEIVSKSKIGVIPNLWDEPFGKVALEFLGFGLKVIYSNSGGLTEILREDTCSFRIDKNDPTSLANLMYEVKSHKNPVDYDLRSEILAQFSQSKISQEWIRLFFSLSEAYELKKNINYGF